MQFSFCPFAPSQRSWVLCINQIDYSKAAGYFCCPNNGKNKWSIGRCFNTLVISLWDRSRYLTCILSAGSAFFLYLMALWHWNGCVHYVCVKKDEAQQLGAHCLIWSLQPCSLNEWGGDEQQFDLIVYWLAVESYCDETTILILAISSSSNRDAWTHWSDTLHQHCIRFDMAGDQHEIYNFHVSSIVIKISVSASINCQTVCQHTHTSPWPHVISHRTKYGYKICISCFLLLQTT